MRDALRLHGALDEHPVRLVLLDSLVPGQPGGRLGREQLMWLADVLRTGTDRPTVIAVHHPPFRTGISHMDEMGLEDGEALAEVVGRHGHVHAALSGQPDAGLVSHLSPIGQWTRTVLH